MDLDTLEERYRQITEKKRALQFRLEQLREEGEAVSIELNETRAAQTNLRHLLEAELLKRGAK